MESVLNNALGWTAFVLIAPVLTFLHEVAHAAVGLSVGLSVGPEGPGSS